MKKVAAFILVLSLLLMNMTVFGEEISHWAEGEVAEAIALGIVPEDMQNQYQSPITRGEFARLAVAFVARRYQMEVQDAVEKYLSEHQDEEGNPLVFDENPFTDIKDSEYAYDIKCANAMGIVKGYGKGIFAPDALITREEGATMLLRVYFCYGSGVKLGEKSAEVDNFLDAKEISAWADTPVRYLYQWDVMKGVSKEFFGPKGRYTREQSYITFLRLEGVDSL